MELSTSNDQPYPPQKIRKIYLSDKNRFADANVDNPGMKLY